MGSTPIRGSNEASRDIHRRKNSRNPVDANQQNGSDLMSKTKVPVQQANRLEEVSWMRIAGGGRGHNLWGMRLLSSRYLANAGIN